jgi:glycosyltransferase involved in cell wall biosynthesis
MKIKNENKLIILTTLYNAEKYVEKCIGSIMGQSITDFRCFITDDLSNDNSVQIVKQIIEGDDRFMLIENNEKLYQPGNYDQIIRGDYDINDNDIIIEIDGDDWLPDSNVLKRVLNVYSNEKVWVANGSFRYSDGRIGFSAPPKNIDNIRNEPFTASHLRTWRAFLWRAINEVDLKDENDKYWEVAGDLSFMFPMIEMAGSEHYVFMNEINYIYNEENPINDHKVNRDKVQKIVNKIRSKSKYYKLR